MESLNAAMDKYTSSNRQESASTDDVSLEDLVQWVEDSDDYFSESNERAIRDREYIDNRQWSEEDSSARLELGRSVITVNRCGPKVRFLTGYEASIRTSARALPRTAQDENGADVVTEGLRYVADACRIDRQFSLAYEYLLVEGIEIVEVGAERARDGKIDPFVRAISWDRFVYDPFSRERDFSDAKYLGEIAWLDVESAISRWPEHEAYLRNAADSGSTFSTIYDDRPGWTQSISGRDRIKLVRMYWNDGGWKSALFCRTAFIEEPGPSVYVDDAGEPVCPIIAGSAMINRDNERYGIVREMIDVQDEINVRRSNAIDFSKMRQTIGEAGAVENVNVAKRELQKPNGHIEIQRGLRFEVLPSIDLSNGNLDALRLAQADIEQMGPNSSLLGKNSQAPSGRAIIASQEGGLYEIRPFLECHNDLKLRTYRAIWDRIRQFWTEERWLRVTDNEEKVRFIGINIPNKVGDVLAEQNNGEIPPDIQEKYGEFFDYPVGVKNSLPEMDMDIVIEQVPHSAVLQQEQFDALIQMAKIAGPDAIPIESLIEASGLRDKQNILKSLRESKESGSNAQEQAQMMAMQKMQAELELTMANVHQKNADAMLKAFQAQIEGLKLSIAEILAAGQPLPIGGQMQPPPPDTQMQMGMQPQMQQPQVYPQELTQESDLYERD